MMMSLPLLVLALAMLPAAAPEGGVPAVAEAELAKLPGHTGFAFCELAADGPQLVYGLRQDERFAVGSSFKLFILGRLAAEVNDDRRQLDGVMRLQAELAGPPHSELAEWPLDSPVTLNTLALKMISISDNTATDHLLFLLGRENVEQQMTEMIGHDAVWNLPLLSTREMTMLRDKAGGLPGVAYQKLDLEARRKFLQEHFRGVPDFESLDFDTSAYNVAEWYATPLDMAKALAWLQRHTGDDQPARLLRAILAIDPKLAYDRAEWPFVGFKGGSEDQLLAGNWLLKNKNGKWYTLNVFYNNPDGKADERQMIEAITAIFKAVEGSLE